ncbi:hypothetical protein [Proteus sp. FME41]|uniref:hypothetical protein n=1 Tax=Proteus sp. FME41 TaxID=2742608 RepID=UPI0018660BBE|nr:hypothetical protein [Proteus sp. FME41]
MKISTSPVVVLVVQFLIAVTKVMEGSACSAPERLLPDNTVNAFITNEDKSNLVHN